MAEVREGVAPKDGLYPQINLNTGVSLAAVVLLVGMVVWTVGLKSDVGYHEARIGAAEKAIEGLRNTVDATRLLSAQAETRLEIRLTRMEITLQDVLSRLVERDRRSVGTP